MSDITITVDDIQYRIPPQGQAVRDTNGEGCDGGIELDTSLEVSMIGAKFIESFATTYDYSNGKIGFGVNVNAFNGTTIVDMLPPIENTTDDMDDTDVTDVTDVEDSEPATNTANTTEPTNRTDSDKADVINVEVWQNIPLDCAIKQTFEYAILTCPDKH